MLKLQIPVNSRGDVFEFKLAKEKVTIGRRHDNDIRIKETYVSAYHAELSRGKNGEIFLRDRDSSNGTFINDRRVRERVMVRKGDILKFGSLKCSIEEVIERINELPPSTRSSINSSVNDRSDGLSLAIRNRTSVVSANSSDGNGRKPSPSLPKGDTTPLDLGTAPLNVGNTSLNGGTFTAPPAPKSGDSNFAAMSHELEALKSQLNLNKSELRKAKDELKTKSAELLKSKEKAAKEDQFKVIKIETLEDQLKSKAKRSDDLDHRLRLAQNRADQFENELEHHKTDMSVEIKAAMQRLAHTKNDNVLLQGTLEALEADRSKFRDESLRLGRKLGKTREGFSFLLQNSGRKIEASDQVRKDLELENQESLNRMGSLEAELDSLRAEFSKMEANYREKLKDAEALQQRSIETQETLIEDLEIANEELKNQKADMVRIESNLESVVAEKEAAEEDWKARVFELKTTNEKLVGCSQDLKTLESQVRNSSDEIKKLRCEKTSLEGSTKELREEKEILSKEKKALAIVSEQISEEKEKNAIAINKVKEEGQRASQKLDTILQNLHESEKKVTYLRNLESELEKSVLRTQRSALSRKGIYREDDESYTTIWPETEQLICRELIERMELLEDLLKRYQQNWFFPKVAEQLNLLRDSFMVLLKNHSVDQFDLEPGTELSVDSRKKIQLISVDDLEDPKLKRLSNQYAESGNRTKVIQTLRPGYIYSKGGQDVIIRKAEVIVA